MVGVVRRPCDYLVSTWAWDHSTQAKLKGGADQVDFAEWVDQVVEKRDEGADWNHGNKFMSAALNTRYQDPNLVHCWVRTHSMDNDLKKCMAQYGSCGGTYSLDGLKADAMDKAHNVADASIKPTKAWSSCSTLFQNATLMKKVMSSEASLLSKYNLGACCSS